MPLVVRSVDRNILNSLRLLSKQSVRIYKKLSRKLVIVHIKSRSEYIYKSLQKEKKKKKKYSLSQNKQSRQSPKWPRGHAMGQDVGKMHSQLFQQNSNLHSMSHGHTQISVPTWNYQNVNLLAIVSTRAVTSQKWLKCYTHKIHITFSPFFKVILGCEISPVSFWLHVESENILDVSKKLLE